MTDLDLIDRKIAAEPTSNATVPMAWIAGELDYLLHMSVQDTAAFGTLHKRLAEAMPTKTLTSHLAMKAMTFSTDFPVEARSR